jgi:hypothetical protein
MAQYSRQSDNGLTLYGLPINPVAGTIAVDSTDNKLKKYNGTGWDLVSGIEDPDMLSAINAESGALADFTQTNLEIVSSSPIHGAKSYRLRHPASGSNSFKRIISVDNKFKGRGVTLATDLMSSAQSANLTILIYDETNSANIAASQPMGTGSAFITATVTSASNQLTGLSNLDFNSISIGMVITGTGIALGTRVTALNANALSATLSQNASSTSTSTKSISALPTKKTFSFTIPANCSSMSYTVTALTETTVCESYIDDIRMFITQYALMNSSVTLTTTPPTVQKFLSGSGTYITPANCSYIRVRMVGGGGGGQGYNSTASAGGGGASTFGSILTANGGAGGSNNVGGLGGIATISSPATGSTFIGGAGGSAGGIANTCGGAGGSSMFGGSGVGGQYAQVAGGAGGANTGGGGGGQGNGAIVSSVSGGGAGGGLDAVIANPLSTYSYIIGTSGTAIGSGGIGGSGYIEVTEYYTIPTVTFPLTTAQLVQTSDSNLTMSGFVASMGSTATSIYTFSAPNYQKMTGDAILYIKDTVNGDYFQAQRNGTYSFVVGFDTSSSSSVSNGMGLSKNSTQLTTGLQGINNSDKLALAYTVDVPYIAWTGPLVIGDKVRVHDIAQGAGASSLYSTLSVSYQGSLKQLNVGTDSKIDIPTHELRFEGASTRGSTDTNIWYYPNQVKIRGDAFSIVNNSINGTVVTVLKPGTLTVSAAMYSTTASLELYITKNQQNLTTQPIENEMMQVSYSITAGTMGNPTATFTVIAGDKIRISGNGVTSTPTNFNLFSLSLTETSILANFSNVLPQWSQSDSSVRLNTANGYGSTNPYVRRFSNNPENLGSAVTYIDSATLGGYFTVNEDGIYNISFCDNFTTISGMGISKNASSPTLGYSAQGLNERLAFVIPPTINYNTETSWSGFLSKNDIIRAHTDGAVNSIADRTTFTISKVGKPNLTSVDVTPFVNLKLPDTNIVGEVVAYAGSNIPDNFLDCAGQAVSRILYSDLFNVMGVTHGSGDGSTTFNVPDYRGRFLRGFDNLASNDPNHASRTAMNTGGNTGNLIGSIQTQATAKNGLILSDPSHNHSLSYNQGGGTYIGTYGNTLTPFNTGGTPNTVGYNTTGITLGAGDAETRPVNASVRYIIRYLANQTGIAIPTTQVSSDTMSFIFQSTVLTGNESVGTFNTYTYTINTSSAVIGTSAPAQSVASMNTNGIQVFARAYNTASTTASPARVDIFIGKGLKSNQVNAYGALSKLSQFNYDYTSQNSTTDTGTQATYNEITGILIITSGLSYNATVTRYVGVDTSSGTFYTNGYFVINASKSPALVTIPNLLPLVVPVPLSNIDWSTTKLNGGIYTQTLGANTTYTFTNMMPGQTIVVRLTNTVSNYTVVWPTVKWAAAVIPTMTVGVKSDIYSFIYDGTSIYGSYIQNMS